MEVRIEDLRTREGDHVHSNLFGSRIKRDVVVSTVFGLLARCLRNKNLRNNTFLKSKEFSQLKRTLNAYDFKAPVMAGNVVEGNVHVGANIDTPPQTPQENTCKPESVRALQASEKGPRIKAKKTNVLAKTLISDLKKALLDNDLGSVLGYTYSSGDERDKEFVQETFSAAFSIVAEKNGYKKALKGMLHEDVYEAGYSYWSSLMQRCLTDLGRPC